MNSKEKNTDKVHKKDLGFDIPEDYFLKSKSEILSKVSTLKEPKIISIFKHRFVWFAASGIALFIALTVFKQQTIPSMKNSPEIVSDTLNASENMDLALNYFFEDNVLVASLFVSDANVESYVINAFLKEVVADEYLDDFIVNELMEEDLF